MHNSIIKNRTACRIACTQKPEVSHSKSEKHALNWRNIQPPKRPKKEYQNQNRNMTWYVGTRQPAVAFEDQNWKFR